MTFHFEETIMVMQFMVNQLTNHTPWSAPSEAPRKTIKPQEIKSLQQKGMSVADIAKHFGVSINTIRSRMPSRKMAKELARIWPDNVTKIVELRAQRVPIKDIAARLDCHTKTIANTLKRWDKGERP